MDAQSNTPNTANQQDAANLQAVNASRIFSPIHTQKKSFEFVKLIHAAFSDSFATNADIAKALGYSENTIKSHLSTAQQFGLLENKYRIGYKVTQLFHEQLRPIDEMEFRQAAIRSLKQQDIFKRLMETYAGRVVPPKDGITNYLIREIKMNDNSALRTADIFMQSLNEYDLVNRFGVLQIDDATVIPSNNEDEKVGDIHSKNVLTYELKPVAEFSNNAATAQLAEIKIPVPLKGGADGEARIAFIVLPNDYNDADLTKISRIALAYREE